ncbi:4SNc-Tudor domain protein [Trypanosoma rangeli]|uniref:4SNc-Tudor domain protein n=1 Tax=Trypanosoma rangeli TaxID=5698 RepID=A0A3R7K553_TRYRA|nr:4SNc-Tudor domain protein [Trypanosoma rangeli]RNF01851.1 4SNc-Tudor domain protein [Trypanosoma rangeli]|eukprot:RNF01851.1 4SNc-Tudor domain protein [Trypanosoma rangeli]
MSYIVFAVDSADRLTLLGPPTPEGPNLKQIALSFIQAPKLARRASNAEFGPEDPFAFEAAELMRTTFIGKPVKFTEDYVIDALQRRAGRLKLASGEDASLLLLRHGFATVPERIPARMEKALFKEYSALMNEAKLARKGVFAPDAASHTRKLRDLTVDETTKLGEKLKGKTVLVRVEQVLLPTVCMVLAESFPDTPIAVHMPGVTVKDPDCFAVASEARFHTERYLLHRRVKIFFEGIDDFGNILGSVTSSTGVFQSELLSRGFVKLNGATLGFTSQSDALHAAEKEAREKRQGIWKNWKEPTDKNTLQVNYGMAATTAAGLPVNNANGSTGLEYKGPLSFSAVVVQIVNGDTITVRSDESREFIRVSLAGVRSSKNITREQDGRSPETRVTYMDYEWEAREFLRIHYIGKRVVVKVEYVRQIPETKEVRPVALLSIPETGVNVGVSLLETGYATFHLGKNDICAAASLLQSATEKARERGLGAFSKGKPPVHKVVELSHLGSARGKYYLSFLQRGMQGNRPPLLKGVVDLVLGGSSIRVYIPKENFQIPVKVAGIITPMGAANNSETADPFAEESKSFAVSMLQQLNVEIQVHTTDKVGNFISSVFLADGTNFSVATVEAGLGTVANADRLPYYQQLIDAERKAQSEQKNIWSNQSSIPQRALKLMAERNANVVGSYTRCVGPKAEFFPCVLSEVGEDGYSVYLQEQCEELEQRLETVQDLAKQVLSSSGEYQPKRGELVVAQYKKDKTWHRAKVLHAKKGDSIVTVLFVDFGTMSEVRVKDVRNIPRGPEFALLRDLEPLARLVRLAFLKSKVPAAETYANYACDVIYDYTDGAAIAKEVYEDGRGLVYCTVTVNENVPSLSETLLQRGVALLDRATATIDTMEYQRHEAAQTIARRGHKGMWQYGDIDDESEDA